MRTATELGIRDRWVIRWLLALGAGIAGGRLASTCADAFLPYMQGHFQHDGDARQQVWAWITIAGGALCFVIALAALTRIERSRWRREHGCDGAIARARARVR
jgi:hypothetical protein